MELTDELIAQASHADATHVALPSMNLQQISSSKALVNLVRLDLSNNGLQSVKALSKCRSLKWLSVASNNLLSLGGIEALPNLMVLNCSYNRLSSIKEIEGLFGLRAFIVNDNRITTLCNFQKLTVLSTLVLSKNPISGLTAALQNVRSLKKLSLSNCKLQELGSIEQLVELKELRLAHNSLKCLSRDLAKNSKLQILDLGNNLFNNLSDIESLNTLPYLRNLNVRGNPFCIQADYEQKIQTWLPALRVLDGRSLKDSFKRKAASQPSCAIRQLKGDTGLHTSDKVKKVKTADNLFRIADNDIHQTFEESFHKIKKHRKAEKASDDQLTENAVAHGDRALEDNICKNKKKVEKVLKDDTAIDAHSQKVKITAGRKDKKLKSKQHHQLQEPLHKARKNVCVAPSDDDSKPFIESIVKMKPDIEAPKEQRRRGLKKEDSGLVSVIQNQLKVPALKKGAHVLKTGSAFSVSMVDVDIGGGGQSSWD